MDANKQDDLALLYRLMQRIDAVPALNEQFKAYVKVPAGTSHWLV